MRRLAAPDFNLRHTLECGQFFRWTREGDEYLVRSGDRAFRCRQDGEALYFEGETPEVVRRFFALDHDLRAIRRDLNGDPHLREALDRYWGLRIIRQDPWDCAVSFITSICSNIPRITRNLADLARRHGGRLPAPESMPGEKVLRRLGFGFRAKYLTRAASMWPSLQPGDLREALMELPGVAEKVADCILLYAFGRLDAFPVDTWIRKVMTQLYFGGRRTPDARIRDLARRRFGPHAGYAQQYLFIHSRENWGEIVAVPECPTRLINASARA